MSCIPSSPSKSERLWCLPPPLARSQVERFLFRPGLQSRARYYAILFLNQLPLSHKVGARLCVGVNVGVWAWCSGKCGYGCVAMHKGRNVTQVGSVVRKR